MWLSGPDFVFSFETRKFMYFLFRETATEAMNCGKAVYSRIARVCKNDQGYDYLKVRVNILELFPYAFIVFSPMHLNELYLFYFLYRIKGKINGPLFLKLV